MGGLVDLVAFLWKEKEANKQELFSHFEQTAHQRESRISLLETVVAAADEAKLSALKSLRDEQEDALRNLSSQHSTTSRDTKRSWQVTSLLSRTTKQTAQNVLRCWIGYCRPNIQLQQNNEAKRIVEGFSELAALSIRTVSRLPNGWM